MAEIYRATMPGIGSFEKMVAIKKILPHLSENEEFITMLIDEARILVGLTHANVAQVYDLGQIDDCYYIAMEYVHGVDFATMLKEAEKSKEFLLKGGSQDA
jgi:serine/threonine protein kinase